MKLQDIHTDFKTDKGTDHTYIPVYDRLFESIRTRRNNILEIGVLLGGSLKMWHTYFENSEVYGVDDFSQYEGFQGVPVQGADVIKDLARYPRVHLKVFDSNNPIKAREQLGNLKFEVIIDDASHSLANQLGNVATYLPYVAKGGLYIIEDIQCDHYASILCAEIERLSPMQAFNIPLNIRYRADDRLVIANFPTPNPVLVS